MLTGTLNIDWTQAWQGAINLAQSYETLILILSILSFLSVVLGLPLWLLAVIKRWSKPGKITPAATKRKRRSKSRQYQPKEVVSPSLPKKEMVSPSLPKKETAAGWNGGKIALRLLFRISNAFRYHRARVRGLFYMLLAQLKR